MIDDTAKARREVYKTLSLCDFCTRKIAISFIDEIPTSFLGNVKLKGWFVFSVTTLIVLVICEIAFVTSLLMSSSSVAAFVSSFHIFGYGLMSLAKCLMLWFKRTVFRQVVNDLVDLWPVAAKDEESAVLKRQSLTALRFVQLCYLIWTLVGITFFYVTPVAHYVYNLNRGLPADLGYMWEASYPFDKTKPILHELVYVFECFSGIVSVWAQLGSDMIFTTMASHITMLLRLLQVRIRNLGDLAAGKSIKRTNGQGRCTRGNKKDADEMDCYTEIVSVIKVHQRLISYSKELEDVFGMVNLINVLLSSVNICCVVFNIALLEPWTDVNNKFFLGAALIQVGILCWYADDIYRASLGVADAVYESGWYKTNPRCRRALLLLLQRSQKPLYFTALKFRNITMTTYTSTSGYNVFRDKYYTMWRDLGLAPTSNRSVNVNIITTSYSYFTLLYTMYSE